MWFGRRGLQSGILEYLLYNKSENRNNTNVSRTGEIVTLLGFFRDGDPEGDIDRGSSSRDVRPGSEFSSGEQWNLIRCTKQLEMNRSIEKTLNACFSGLSERAIRWYRKGLERGLWRSEWILCATSGKYHHLNRSKQSKVRRGWY